jgi:hypothetical protein
MPERSNGMDSFKEKLKPTAAWYKRTWVIVVLLIGIFPLGIFLMWKYANWNKPVKGLITAAWAVVIVAAVVLSPPSIAVKSSLNAVEAANYTLEGEVSPSGAVVTVNGKGIVKDGKKFKADVQLAEGDNTLTIVATDGDKKTEKQVKIHRTTQQEIDQRKADEDAKRKKAANEAKQKQASQTQTSSQKPTTKSQTSSQKPTTKPKTQPTKASLAAQVETAYLKQIGYSSIAELNLDKDGVVGSPENEITSFTDENSGVVKVNVQGSLTKTQAKQIGTDVMVGASDVKSLKWVDVRGTNGTYAEVSRQDAGLAD